MRFFLFILGLTIIYCFGFIGQLTAQRDSTAITTEVIDSLINLEEEKEREIVPRKSLILALSFPGLGQLYNGRWWKLPFVYGAFGGIIYSIDYNTDLYKRLNTALNLARQDEEHEFSGTSIDDVNTLQVTRDQFDKNRQLSYIGLVIVYALQAVEAYADAHLINFDMDEDLSRLKLRPTLEISSPIVGPYMGLQLTIPLNKNELSATTNNSFWTE